MNIRRGCAALITAGLTAATMFTTGLAPDADASPSESTHTDLSTSLPAQLEKAVNIPALGSWPIDIRVAPPQVFTYLSQRADGIAVEVNGTLIEPKTPWTGTGERPTVAFAPGTRGQGDHCAPSHSANSYLLGENLNYETAFVDLALARGYRVVITDYIGLGTPGHHTYMNHTEEAHALLDAARAGLKLAGAAPDAPVALAGYSQGGGAAAAAAEIADTYAPDLNIKSTFAGAAPADLHAVMQAVDKSSIVGVLGYALNGYFERYPEIREEAQPFINEAGQKMLDDVANSCLVGTVAKWRFTPSSKFTTTGESLPELVKRLPKTNALLSSQKLGQRAPKSPIMLASSMSDDILPYEQMHQLARDYCAAGGDVYFDGSPKVLPILEYHMGTNHGVGSTAFVKGMEYIEANFNGTQAQNNCGA